jgi:hypothetical protein
MHACQWTGGPALSPGFARRTPRVSLVPPCLLGNPPDCPWPLAPPPPTAQSVCSIPIFNTYNSVTTCECNPRTQNLSEKTPWNTSEVAERAWRGRRMDSAHCFCRPKDEGHVPNAFWANVSATVTYVRRKNPPRACRFLRSNANDFHVPYARLPRFEPTWLCHHIHNFSLPQKQE